MPFRYPLEAVKAVTFVLVRDGNVLLEKCPKKAERHGGEWFIPGGRIEDADRGSTVAALVREMGEELGCYPESAEALPLVDACGGPAWPSFLIRPYLVREWSGDVPAHCLDHPAVPLRWVPLAEALLSPVRAVRCMLAGLPAA